jgi:predicted membrane protein
MNENAAPGFFSGLATKAIAVVVLLIAAWILFKLVIGVVAAVAWVVVAVLAVVAVLWAMSALRR